MTPVDQGKHIIALEDLLTKIYTLAIANKTGLSREMVLEIESVVGLRQK